MKKSIIIVIVGICSFLLNAAGKEKAEVVCALPLRIKTYKARALEKEEPLKLAVIYTSCTPEKPLTHGSEVINALYKKNPEQVNKMSKKGLKWYYALIQSIEIKVKRWEDLLQIARNAPQKNEKYIEWLDIQKENEYLPYEHLEYNIKCQEKDGQTCILVPG